MYKIGCPSENTQSLCVIVFPDYFSKESIRGALSVRPWADFHMKSALAKGSSDETPLHWLADSKGALLDIWPYYCK